MLHELWIQCKVALRWLILGSKSQTFRVKNTPVSLLDPIAGVKSNDRGEPAVSLQMNRLSLRNNRLKFKTAGKLLIILEEFIEYTPI